MKKTKQEKNSLIKIVDFIDFNQEIIGDDKTFEKIMFIYSIAIKELKTKIEILQEESKIFNKYDLIDHINTRVKTPKNKIKKRRLPHEKDSHDSYWRHHSLTEGRQWSDTPDHLRPASGICTRCQTVLPYRRPAAVQYRQHQHAARTLAPDCSCYQRALHAI